jgi:DNA invertase Pin-like site-specific DNA recombinase
MTRLKTKAQLDQEHMEEVRYALGNYTPDTNKLLLIYARQSSSKQYVSNIYSAMEQRDGLLERASGLGWVHDEQWILYVENQLAKKTQVSGSLRIDQRPGLQALTEVIQEGKASAVLVVSVDRITRDEDLITPTQFANLCKRYGVVIITDDYIYDFNNPNRDDMGRFMNEAIASKEYVRKQIKGKMLKNRTRKANMGLVANGRAPVGLMLDESRNNLVPSPHAERVDWLYGRFRALDASLTGLLREIVNMTLRGEALFPVDEHIDPKSMHLDRTPNDNGWTIRSREGLRYILTNPMYAGHLVFNHKIVKLNAHPAIVNLDNWQYAFDRLSDVDLDGQPIERQKRTVRYTQGASVDSGALLTGTRDSGKVVIDGVNGAHIYFNKDKKSYLIYRLNKVAVYNTETSIYTKTLDAIVESRLLHWLGISERQGEDWIVIKERVEKWEKTEKREEMTWLVSGTAKGEQTPYKAMDKVGQTTRPTQMSTIQGDLELTNQELATVQRALQFQNSMSDERLEDTLKKEARLIKRRAELIHAQNQAEKLAKQQAQGKADIETAASKWSKWSIEERRSFIRQVTER